MNLKNGGNFGIIDIGSNTVRGVLYKGREKPSASGDIVFSSHILSETRGGILSRRGMEDLCRILSEINKFFDKSGCEYIYAFATSAMRDVKNFAEVYQKVKEETGILIDVITGRKEAEYDYLALKTVNSQERGIGVDLGGGSAQVVCFDREGITEWTSVALGAKRVRNLFCRELIPCEEERAKIEEYVYGALVEIKSRNENIWFMGGTAKAALKAARVLFGAEYITPAVLENLFDILKNNPPLLKKLFGKRYDTMPAGICVMKAICGYLGGEEITVTGAGVRDGYVKALTEKER